MVFADRVDAGAQLAARLEPSGDGTPSSWACPVEASQSPLRSPSASTCPSTSSWSASSCPLPARAWPWAPSVRMEPGSSTGLSSGENLHVRRGERETLNARVSHLRRGQPRIDLRDKVAIVVDDGVATGATARVACGWPATSVLPGSCSPSRSWLPRRLASPSEARGGRGRLRLGAPVLPRRGRPLPGLHPDDRRRGRQPAQTGP